MHWDAAGEVIGGLGALVLAAGAYAYAAMSPASQIFGRTLVWPPRPDEIALTFDDGPNPAWTPRLLEILDRHNVKATFFLVGRFASAEPLLTQSIASAGHAVGNHSWSHPNLALTAPAKVREELRKTNDALEQILGRPVRLFRPPYGARRPDVLRAARELGLTPVLWNAMTNDWKELSSERIFQRLSAKVDAANRRDRAATIVLHDGNGVQQGADRGPSVQAAEMLLERYASTRQFVTVEQWRYGFCAP